MDQATPGAEHQQSLEERETLATDIGGDLTDQFVAYIRGEIPFDELSFMVYDSLTELHIIASGEYELEYIDEDDIDTDYHEKEATAEQEDLAQEPSR
ncbi:MAG: hypothetical protein M3R06_03290 [Chloroflexota bacterium]|nr:hypothetical protein [Chloroflexota bacterium]